MRHMPLQHCWAKATVRSTCRLDGDLSFIFQSTGATPAHCTTLRKRSQRRRPRAEASTTARSTAEHPAASLLQAWTDSTEPATSTTPPGSSLPIDSPASTTSCPTSHHHFPSAESHRRRLPCMVSPIVLFRLRRVPYPSLMLPHTTMPRLITGDGQNRSVNHLRGRGGGEGVPCFRFGPANFGP
jgi:hypothetical protein